MTEWRDQRIWITGGTGFLGKALVRHMLDVGYADLLATGLERCDLRDPQATRQFLHQHSPDVVIHLAAVVGGIGANRERPGEFFYNNLIMGTQLLHESWKAGVSKFVAIGTVCAYPKHTRVPFSESDLWDGYPEETNAPYGLAKKMLLVQSQAYRQQYGFNSIYLLPVNLYGPGDNFDLSSSHVIPALIRKCVEAIEQGHAPLQAWGDGTPTREFLYVEDAAEAIRAALERYDKPGPVNIGSGVEISMNDLVRLIAEETGYQGKVIWDPSKPNGQPRRCLDTSLAEQEFGFKARTDFRAGLRRTIQCYREAALSQLSG